MIDLVFWAPVMLAGAIAGSSSGLLGVFIIGMRIPFLAVCVAHAALAGAVFGALAGLAGQWLLLPALAGAGVTALALGLASPQRLRADDNALLGFLFSASMGLAFLGIGLFGVLGRSDHDVRSLLWGSLNFCRWQEVRLMGGVALLLAVYVAAFGKELRAILFSREDALAAGIPVRFVWTGFLLLTAAVLTVSFQTVGGLMIYSLVTNPALAAGQLVRGFGRALVLATVLGLAGGLGGFLLAALLDLPTGAMIVLLSSVFVAVAALMARWAHRPGAAALRN